MSKPDILTVTLNPALDNIIYLDKLSFNSVNRIKRICVSAGGKGINVSRALKILDHNPLATGIIGGQSGKHLVILLNQEKIPHDFFYITGSTRRNFTIIQKKSALNTHLLDKGPVITKNDCLEFVSFFTTLLKRKKIVIFSGSAMPGMPVFIFKKLISLAREYKVQTVLDTKDKPLITGIKAWPDILKLNSHELADISGHKINSTDDKIKAVDMLYKKGLKIIIITDSHKEVIARTSDGFFIVKPPKIQPLNTVGSGDAFLAGFISKTIAGWILPDALRFAAACGAANVLTEKPGFFNLDAVEKLFKQTHGKKVYGVNLL